MKKRAFVRYSKQGKIVPGSLILTSGSYPQGSSTWKEVPADLCCNSGVKLTIEAASITFPIDTPYVQFFCGTGPTLVAGAVTGTYDDVYELVAALNAQLGYMGEFGVDGNGDVVLAISVDIATTLFKNPECSGVSGTITAFVVPGP
jgi:hypothetical protein